MTIGNAMLGSLIVGAIFLLVVFLVGPMFAWLDWERQTRNDMGDE
jgi:hypothetical protein